MTKARDLANLISGGFTEADIPNLSASKITSGTFADARIAASNVSQHAQSFDDNKIVNDISTLGLRVHTQENLNASNTNSASFDVFQDSSGITNLTNSSRSIDEYVNSTTATLGEHTNDSNTKLLLVSNTTNGSTTFTDLSSNDFDWYAVSGASHSTAQKKIGSSSLFIDYGQRMYNNDATSQYNLANMSNTFTIEFWVYVNTMNGATFLSFGSNGNAAMWRMSFGSGNFILQAKSAETWTWSGSTSINLLSSGTLNTGQWYHIAFVNDNTSVKTFVDGVQQNTGTLNLSSNGGSYNLYLGSYYSDPGETDFYIDSFRISNNARYSSTFNPNSTSTYNATGSFEGNAITASSTNKMGAVITYQDNAGTNALNTDIILKLSADNGSNYSTATLTALPDFATGIKMCKVNDLSVTAGTQLKYKIEFANQASGSKEARIRGVSLQY